MAKEFSDLHQMVMTAVYETGAEKWTCPVCGRQFVMTWPPSYKKIVLCEGDQSVPHASDKTAEGLGVNYSVTSPSEDIDLDLGPWDEWMEGNEDLWTKPISPQS